MKHYVKQWKDIEIILTVTTISQIIGPIKSICLLVRVPSPTINDKRDIYIHTQYISREYKYQLVEKFFKIIITIKK